MYESMNMFYLQILTMKNETTSIPVCISETGNRENIIPCGLLGFVHKENTIVLLVEKPCKASKDLKNSLAFTYIRSYWNRKKSFLVPLWVHQQDQCKIVPISLDDL